MKKSIQKARKAAAVTLSLALAGSMLFVAPEAAAASKKKAKVKLNKTRLTLRVGKTYKLKLKNNKKKIKWSSSKKKVATVSKKGKVKAKKAGTARITAKVGKKKYVCKVTVKNKKKTTKTTTTKKPTVTKAPANNTTTTEATPSPTPLSKKGRSHGVRPMTPTDLISSSPSVYYTFKKIRWRYKKYKNPQQTAIYAIALTKGWAVSGINFASPPNIASEV